MLRCLPAHDSDIDHSRPLWNQSHLSCLIHWLLTLWLQLAEDLGTIGTREGLLADVLGIASVLCVHLH
jgi:hypothetical protein